MLARKFPAAADRKSTRLNSSHLVISYAVFCLKKKEQTPKDRRLVGDLCSPSAPARNAPWARGERGRERSGGARDAAVSAWGACGSFFLNRPGPTEIYPLPLPAPLPA